LSILAGLGLLVPQQPPTHEPPAHEPPTSQPEAKPQTWLQVYRAFPDTKRQTLVRGLLRRVQLDPDPAIQRIVSMQQNRRRLPVQKPQVAHDPSVWANGVAPARKLIRVGSRAHDTLRRRVPRVRFLPELHRGVRYDWSSGQVVRRAKELTPDEEVENLWRGYPPGTDWALARIQARLDADHKQRKVGAYLDHLYADLGAHTYEDVTLYEAWFSGEDIAVPDVDAIPFAVNILGDRSFRSPIPGNRRRERLYRKIRDHAMRFRSYRTLIEAAAAAFVAADPVMEPEYKKMLPRFHYLLVAHDDDIDAVAKKVATVKSPKQMDRFLSTITKKLESDRKAWQLYQQRLKELENMAARLRGLTARAIHNAQAW
jgi:hypothetical protein